MTVRSIIAQVFQQEDINFLLTNRIPRRLLTQFMGWFSKIEQPLIRDASIGLWQLFSDLDLGDSKKTSFRSMHECFTRELREGARPVDLDPNIIVSPCDAIVGAFGQIQGTELLQIKGFPYGLKDLIGGADLVELYREGLYVTLRLTAGMYHRFHAPHDCHIEAVRYISGDTWNVNPIALKRIEKLFCKNERAVIQTRLDATGDVVTLVPVAAILVASIRLRCLDVMHALRDLGSRPWHGNVGYRKGDELGWFEHGSTIVVLAPKTFEITENVQAGRGIRMGERLLRKR